MVFCAFANQEDKGKKQCHTFRYDNGNPHAVYFENERQQQNRCNLKYKCSKEGNQCRG